MFCFLNFIRLIRQSWSRPALISLGSAELFSATRAALGDRPAEGAPRLSSLESARCRERTGGPLKNGGNTGISISTHLATFKLSICVHSSVYNPILLLIMGIIYK